METPQQYQLSISFNTMDELQQYMQQYSQFTRWQERKLAAASTEKKLNDKRGQHVRVLHEQTREYMQQSPDAKGLSYKECFKLVSSKK